MYACLLVVPISLRAIFLLLKFTLASSNTFSAPSKYASTLVEGSLKTLNSLLFNEKASSGKVKPVVFTRIKGLVAVVLTLLTVNSRPFIYVNFVMSVSAALRSAADCDPAILILSPLASPAGVPVV